MIDWDRLDEQPTFYRHGGSFTIGRSPVEQRSRRRARSQTPTPRLDQRKHRLAILAYLLEREERDADQP